MMSSTKRKLCIVILFLIVVCVPAYFVYVHYFEKDYQSFSELVGYEDDVIYLRTSNIWNYDDLSKLDEVGEYVNGYYAKVPKFKRGEDLMTFDLRYYLVDSKGDFVCAVNYKVFSDSNEKQVIIDDEYYYFVPKYAGDKVSKEITALYY